MSLTARLVFTIALILAFAAGMMVLLEADKFERTFLQLRQSRLAISLQDIRDTLEVDINLGMPVAALQSNLQLLNQVRQSHTNVLAIEVFDANGKIQFGTDPSFDGDFVAEKWLAAAHASGGEQWLVDDASADVYVAGMPLLGSRGEVAGGVVLLYDRSVVRATVQAVTIRLGISFGAAVAVAIAVCAALLWLLLAPTRRTLADMATWAEQAADGGGVPTVVARLPLQEDCLAFLRAGEAAKAEIAATMDRIRAIDQMEDGHLP